MSLSSSLAGRRAKSNGKSFEEIFKDACMRQGMVATRFPDGCRQVGPKQLVREKTPFDWILTYQGRSAFIDTKTCASDFPHSKIEHHQVEEMLRHARAGALAGYVIWMRELNEILFIGAEFLLPLMTVRGSVRHVPGVTALLGGVADFRVERIFLEVPLLTRAPLTEEP